jgi:hypothetical protein
VGALFDNGVGLVSCLVSGAELNERRSHVFCHRGDHRSRDLSGATAIPRMPRGWRTEVAEPDSLLRSRGTPSPNFGALGSGSCISTHHCVARAPVAMSEDRPGEGLESRHGQAFFFHVLFVFRPCVPGRMCLALISGRSGVRQISTRDVSTALLQSDPFPEADRRYLKIISPIDGSVAYWRQLRPLYGDSLGEAPEAPARWAKTLADWLS